MDWRLTYFINDLDEHDAVWDLLVAGGYDGIPYWLDSNKYLP